MGFWLPPLPPLPPPFVPPLPAEPPFVLPAWDIVPALLPPSPPWFEPALPPLLLPPVDVVLSSSSPQAAAPIAANSATPPNHARFDSNPDILVLPWPRIPGRRRGR